ncbi:UDP-glucuronosyltransferase 1-1 [Homalodisca vitripennis]|nr:UDP-glucuronosyltransferase 1-1 [Homalodisca vitripennis]
MARSGCSPTTVTRCECPSASSVTQKIIRALRAGCLPAHFTAAARSANILAIVPTLSSSHFVVFEVLIKDLLKRGHTVTTVTTFPQKTSIANLTDIDVSSDRTVFKNNLPVEFLSVIPERFFSVAHRFFDYLADVEKILSVPEVEALINSKTVFDLVIYETFIDDVFLGFAHKFRAPVVTIGSCHMFPWVVDRFGIPANPAYIPGFYSDYSGTLNFYQRVENTFLDLTCRLFYKFLLEPRMTEVVKKFFGRDTPPVRDLVKNISLYLVNTHSSFYGARPFPPQVVDVAGIHLASPKRLPAVRTILNKVGYAIPHQSQQMKSFSRHLAICVNINNAFPFLFVKLGYMTVFK